MKYKIGDVLLIKSHIDSFESCNEEKFIKVSTSCSNGYDTFKYNPELNINNNYIYHDVTVTGYDYYTDGSFSYRTINDLSRHGHGWQGVAEKDIIKLVSSKESSVTINMNDYIDKNNTYITTTKFAEKDEMKNESVELKKYMRKQISIYRWKGRIK